MAYPPKAPPRHAHFRCDEEDSGEESSSGLQLPSRRARARTILQQNGGLSGGSPNNATTSTLSNTADNALSLPDARSYGMDSGSSALKRPVNPESALADSTGDVLPPTSSPVAKRQRVRMNSQPVTVSMPAVTTSNASQLSEMSNDDASRGRPRLRDPSPPLTEHGESDVRFVEMISSRRSSAIRAPTPTWPSSNKEEHSATDKLHKSKRSRIRETISSSYNKIKSSHRVSWIIPTITNYNLMKPVIRSSISAWIGLVFLLINPILRIEGQSAFFSVVVAFISPPNLPLVQAMEQIIYLWVFVGLAWAWVAICAACISAVRTNYVNPAFLAEVERKYAGLKATNPEQYQRRIIFEGTYIQAKPAVLCAVFLAVGTAILTLIKIKTTPSPFTFALVLACVLMAVSFTLLHYFPYDYYEIGSLFMLPMTFQLAIAVFCSIFVFPTSVSSSFTTGLNKILNPVLSAVQDMSALFDEMIEVKRQVLCKGEASDGEAKATQERNQQSEVLRKWAATGMEIRRTVASAAAGLGPLKGQEPYLTKEASFSKFCGKDIQELFVPTQAVQLRFSGIGIFFEIIATAIEHSHLDSAVFTASASRPASPAPSRTPSIRTGGRGKSPRRSESHGNLVEHSTHIGSPLASQYTMTSETAVSEVSSRRESHHSHSIGHVLHKRLHLPHLPLSWRHDRHDREDHGLSYDDRVSSHTSLMDQSKREAPAVGVYESMKYMALESKDEIDPEYFIRQFGLLAKSSLPLVHAIIAALKEAVDWHLQVDKDRSVYRGMLRLGRTDQEREGASHRHQTVTRELEAAMDRYSLVDRLEILNPFRPLFDVTCQGEIDPAKLQHRGVYWSYLYISHLTESAKALLSLMKKQAELDARRSQRRIWWPRLSFDFFRYFRRRDDEGADSGDVHDEVDPDDDLQEAYQLGHAKRRDPDNKPFATESLNILRYVGKAGDFLTSKEAFFSLKAGILVVCLALPAYIQSSAGFYYYEKGFWALIMGQLTISLNSAETAAAWLQRLQATFWGCLTGMLLWYLCAGSGHGNRYALAVVTAIAFPILMTIRIYWPGPPLAAIIFAVSAGLVVSYSWINTHLLQTTNLTYGWNVAYTRFIAVCIGITAAWIISALPPTRSARKGIRQSYSNTIKQLGVMMCDIVSETLDPYYVEQPEADCSTRKKVLAMKRRLVKLKSRHNNIGFEVSFKGVWPADRYAALHTVCEEINSLLGQVHHATKDMPYPWRKALCERTQLSNSVFLGEMLAIISLCASALHSGTPLAQISPGPLAERLLSNNYGFSISKEHYAGVPSEVTVPVLESLEYQQYALATSTVFFVVRRLDKLLIVVKTLVGEDLHVENINLGRDYSA